jgi:hypothetical protein
MNSPTTVVPTSSSLVVAIATTTTTKPKFPSTAYMYFTRYERNWVQRFGTTTSINHVESITIEDIKDILLQQGTENDDSCCSRTQQRQLSFVEFVKHISTKWKGLAPHVRQLFLDLADQDYIRYVNEMKGWNSNNDHIGNDQLLQQ